MSSTTCPPQPSKWPLKVQLRSLQYHQFSFHYIGNFTVKFAVLEHLNLSFFLTFQFLKKVQRQERIVEEIKMVLKPFYQKKKISKDSYKEIMRKCVPKVSKPRKIIYAHYKVC